MSSKRRPKTKICKECERRLPLTLFHKRSIAHDGMHWNCKPCTKTIELARATMPARKKCKNCCKTKAASMFHRDRRKVDGLYIVCKKCVAERLPQYLLKRKEIYRTPIGFKKALLRMARSRSRKLGIPFNLTTDDIHLSDRCPVIGIPLVIGSGGFSHNAPTLDRQVPSKGYVRGNVTVISFLANRIKGDQTDPNLFRKVAQYLDEMN